jgi:hypothetical protein
MVNNVLTNPKQYRDQDLSCPRVGYDAGLGPRDDPGWRHWDGSGGRSIDTGKGGSSSGACDRAGDAVGVIAAEVEAGERLDEVRGTDEAAFPARVGAANGRDQPLATSPDVSRISTEARDPIPAVETGITVPGLAEVLPVPVPELFCDKMGGWAAGR